MSLYEIEVSGRYGRTLVVVDLSDHQAVGLMKVSAHINRKSKGPAEPTLHMSTALDDEPDEGEL